MVVSSMVKGTAKYYITKTEKGKLSGKISLKDAVTSELPFENLEELLVEYNEKTGELIFRRM